MNEEKKTNIDEYIALHKSGIPLNRVKPIACQTFNTLKNSNVDIRIIDRDKNLGRLYKLGQLGQFSKDTVEHSHRYFYSIPLQTVTGTIVGFIYRTVYGKAYTTVSRSFNNKECKVPIMFGFYKDFENFDQFEHSKPIIVCEGLKDCITLKKIYPYVLSNNTSHMGMNLQVLSNLTNKFILIYDNDKAGQDGTQEDISKLQQRKNCNVIGMKINQGYKDITDVSENADYFDRIKRDILENIRKLEHSEGLNTSCRRSIVKR